MRKIEHGTYVIRMGKLHQGVLNLFNYFRNCFRIVRRTYGVVKCVISFQLEGTHLYNIIITNIINFGTRRENIHTVSLYTF